MDYLFELGKTEIPASVARDDYETIHKYRQLRNLAIRAFKNSDDEVAKAGIVSLVSDLKIETPINRS